MHMFISKPQPGWSDSGPPFLVPLPQLPSLPLPLLSLLTADIVGLALVLTNVSSPLVHPSPPTSPRQARHDRMSLPRSGGSRCLGWSTDGESDGGGAIGSMVFCFQLVIGKGAPRDNSLAGSGASAVIVLAARG